MLVSKVRHSKNNRNNVFNSASGSLYALYAALHNRVMAPQGQSLAGIQKEGDGMNQCCYKQS